MKSRRIERSAGISVQNCIDILVLSPVCTFTIFITSRLSMLCISPGSRVISCRPKVFGREQVIILNNKCL